MIVLKKALQKGGIQKLKGGIFMKKRVLTILGAVLLVCTFTKTAFAATGDTSSQSNIDKRISNLEDRQQKIDQKKTAFETKLQQFKTKQEEYNQFRAALVQKREAMLDNKDKNIALVSENNKLRLDVANAIKALQTNGTKLDESVIAQIKDLNSQIKTVVTQIKDTKGDIKDIISQNKGFIKAKDYTAMNSAFDKIYSIQQERNEKLQQINNLLKQMLSLINA